MKTHYKVKIWPHTKDADISFQKVERETGRMCIGIRFSDWDAETSVRIDLTQEEALLFSERLKEMALTINTNQ